MYGLGGLGNLQDILAGMKPGSAVLRTENDPGLKKDLIGHTQLSDNNDKILIDWGRNSYLHRKNEIEIVKC